MKDRIGIRLQIILKRESIRSRDHTRTTIVSKLTLIGWANSSGAEAWFTSALSCAWACAARRCWACTRNACLLSCLWSRGNTVLSPPHSHNDIKIISVMNEYTYTKSQWADFLNQNHLIKVRDWSWSQCCLYGLHNLNPSKASGGVYRLSFESQPGCDKH